MVLALSNDRLKASTVLKSGFGEPWRTATPTPTRPNTVREFGHDLALLDQGVNVVGQDDDVVGFAGVDLPDQGRGQVEVGDQLVSAGALELRGECLVRSARRAGDEGFDFSGLGDLCHE